MPHGTAVKHAQNTPNPQVEGYTACEVGVCVPDGCVHVPVGLLTSVIPHAVTVYAWLKTAGHLDGRSRLDPACVSHHDIGPGTLADWRNGRPALAELQRKGWVL
jgi:hypothetical protein